MPLYLYEHPGTGETREIVAPIASRDDVTPPGFVRVPAAPGVVVAHRQRPTLEQELKQGYHDREQREGSRFHPAHSMAQIQDAISRTP